MIELQRKHSEMSFTRHFYKPQPMRTLEEFRADMLANVMETGKILDVFLRGVNV